MMSKKTLNAAAMKQRNQNKIVESLLVSECSRAELARRTGLTRAAISLIIDELLERGIVVEGAPILGKVGRKSHVIKLNADRYHIIGIDLARDNCHIGFMNFGGRVLASVKMKMCASAPAMLDQILAVIRETQRSHDLPGALMGIGITAPGPLDPADGVILTPPDFDNWFHVNVTHFFRDHFDCPVFLENNANARALAEKYCGAGQAYTNFAELIIDTGIGSGIILNNSLYRVSSGFGSNFGHMSINFQGPVCKCGNLGCAELYASIPNIIKYAVSLDPALDNWPEITDRAASGDETALKIIDVESDYLTILITNIMNILDVECIIMAGDITYRAELISRMLEQKLKDRYLSRDIKQLAILPSALNKDAQIISASYLVIENSLKQR